MILLTRANGQPVSVNPDKVLFAQPFHSSDAPGAASQIYFTSADCVSLKDTFDEVRAKVWPSTMKPKGGEIGA